MPSYVYDRLRKEFVMFYRRSKDKSTKTVWQFCRDYEIGHTSAPGKPCRQSVYSWYHSMKS